MYADLFPYKILSVRFKFCIYLGEARLSVDSFGEDVFLFEKSILKSSYGIIW